MRWTCLVVMLVAPAACFFGPSEERLRCLRYCEQQNDACIINAATSQAVQQCSAWATQCTTSCPPR